MDVTFHAYALTAVALFLKMGANSIVQGIGRVGSKTFVIPEDARFFAGTEPAANEAPIALRGQAVWRNDLENIPIFLILGLVYVMARCPTRGALVLFPIFVGARILHTFFYFQAMQPWRTIVYTIGLGVSVTLCVLIVIRVFAESAVG